MDDMIQNEMEEVHLLDLVLVLVKRMRFILIFTFTLSFLTAVYSLITPEIYQGTARILPPLKESSGASAAILGQLAAMMPAGLGGGPASPSDLLVGMVTESRTIADAIIDRFNLMELYEAKTRMDAIKELSKVLKAQSDRKSGIVTIQVEDEDPKRAADMANAFVEELIKTERKLSTTEAAQKRLFYETQIKETHADLVRAEEALQKFQETTGAIKIDNQAEAVFSGYRQPEGPDYRQRNSAQGHEDLYHSVQPGSEAGGRGAGRHEGTAEETGGRRGQFLWQYDHPDLRDARIGRRIPPEVERVQDPGSNL